MIDRLLNNVEDKIGFKIINRGDCELMSNIILDVLGIEISYNTIRRLYGLAPSTKPNINTLNILSKFLGYSDYIKFCQEYEIKEKQILSSKIYKLIYDGDRKKILGNIHTIKNSHQNFTEFITLLIRELFHAKKFILIDEIFNLNELNYNNFTYSELLHIGNCIGLIIRRQGLNDIALMNNINLLHCVYLTFVDYSSLNGYYGKWTNYVSKRNKSGDIMIFSSAILDLKNFLNNKKITFNNFELIYSDKLNPILRSRLLSLFIIKKNKEDITKLLNSYYKSHKKSDLSDLYYELFTTAILINNLEMMKYLSKLSLKIEYYYQKSHLNNFYLMCMFYYKLIGEKKKEIKYFNLFTLDETRYSYQEFVSIFYNIYLFNNSENSAEKRIIKEKYTKTVKKMEYLFFDEIYLKTYFK
ncbi:MAG: hypothetical protein P8I11_03885 [Bacteroidia bacterium]|nr:hypothetical protein [Bacteroidia bacterium]